MATDHLKTSKFNSRNVVYIKWVGGATSSVQYNIFMAFDIRRGLLVNYIK